MSQTGAPTCKAFRSSYLHDSRAGQAAVEYILIVAMVVGIIGGVIAPVFQKKIEGYQTRIAEESASVISQRTMGIPYGWFFGGNDGDFKSLDGKFDGGGGGGAGGSGPGSTSGNSGNGANGDKGDDKGGGGSGPGAGSNSATGSGFGGDSGNSGNKSGSGRKGGGAGGADEDNPKDIDLRKSGSGGSGNGNGGDGSQGGDTKKIVGPDGKEVDVKVEPGDTGPAELAKRRLQEQSRIEQSQAGGCRSMNLFTILKIIAVIVLIVIAGVVALTSKGNKGSD